MREKKLIKKNVLEIISYFVDFKNRAKLKQIEVETIKIPTRFQLHFCPTF